MLGRRISGRGGIYLQSPLGLSAPMLGWQCLPRASMRKYLVGSLLILCVVGCSSAAPNLVGAECSAQADCGGGLMCLTLGTFSDAGCSPGPKACSKTCQGDTDCASLGANFMCFATCGGSSVCGQAG
jgi:hypothetical protein